MSQVEVDAPQGRGERRDPPPLTAGRRTTFLGTLFRNELLTTFRRRRTLALLSVLAAVPGLIGLPVKIETHRHPPPLPGGRTAARGSGQRGTLNANPVACGSGHKPLERGGSAPKGSVARAGRSTASGSAAASAGG